MVPGIQLGDLEGVFSVLRFQDFVTTSLEAFPHGFPDWGLVFGEQYSSCFGQATALI
jgi:hypothetical protein